MNKVTNVNADYLNLYILFICDLQILKTILYSLNYDNY